MSRKKIDFMLVGFAKCGTTTLFEYLKRHPDIYMPPYKECILENTTFNGFMNRHFPRRKIKGKVIGHISPMWATVARQAYRIFHEDTKIIIATRDPEARKASYLRQRIKDGHEASDWWVDRENDYERWINEWKALYRHVFVYDLFEMEKDPINLIKRIYDFLGVKQYPVEKLGKYNVQAGGNTHKVNKIKKIPLIKKIIPIRVRNYIYYKIWRGNNDERDKKQG